MGNETECTGFLARTTIKPETKAGLDKTESIMVRRPSPKWNFHAGARTSMKVDLLRPARLFIFHFLLREHSLSYLRTLKSLSTPRIFYVPRSIRGSACFFPTFSRSGSRKKPEIKKKEEKLGHVSRGRPPSRRAEYFEKKINKFKSILHLSTNQPKFLCCVKKGTFQRSSITELLLLLYYHINSLFCTSVDRLKLPSAMNLNKFIRNIFISSRKIQVENSPKAICNFLPSLSSDSFRVVTEISNTLERRGDNLILFLCSCTNSFETLLDNISFRTSEIQRTKKKKYVLYRYRVSYIEEEQYSYISLLFRSCPRNNGSLTPGTAELLQR